MIFFQGFVFKRYYISTWQSVWEPDNTDIFVSESNTHKTYCEALYLNAFVVIEEVFHIRLHVVVCIW